MYVVDVGVGGEGVGGLLVVVGEYDGVYVLCV